MITRVKITPEVLERNGFKPHEDDGEVCSGSDYDRLKAWRISQLIICLVGKKYSMHIECDDNYYNTQIFSMEYFDELQTLYLLLTGNKLSYYE